MLRLCVLLGLLAAAPLATAQVLPASLTLLGTDALLLQNGFVSATFNLTQGALTTLRGRFLGDGDFSASPNLCGAPLPAPGAPRGCLSIAVFSATSATASTTSSTDRPSPLPYTLLANASAEASFTLALQDALGQVSATLTLALAGNSRALRVEASAVALAALSTPLVAVDFKFAAPSALMHYARGIRQAMDLDPSQAYIGSASPLARFYALGDGATGCAELLAAPDNAASASYMFAGRGSVTGGAGAALWGAPAPLDAYVAGFGGSAGNATALVPGQASPTLVFSLLPNDYSFPPSNVPSELPPGVNTTDLRSILTAAHGNAAAPLHSYDFAPEVRATPCLVTGSIPCFGCGACYGSSWNYFDPDSVISTSAMLWSFDPLLAEQVRGQLETNMAHVCLRTDAPGVCEYGQAIHHFYTGQCRENSNCNCSAGPSGNTDCVSYYSLSGGAQTGPNIFTMIGALRYAGATGNLQWLAEHMPRLRAMMAFLDRRFDASVGLYNVPGSLQIDVFKRYNYAADTSAMAVILCELFADAEAALGNATGAAFYTARAGAVRSGMNAFLLHPTQQDHYCTQSDPNASAPSGVQVCARDFIDYDSNAIAVAARVPGSLQLANAILARIDRGVCSHAGRATYVSEVLYDKDNCVGGNTGDSQVAMGRIGWQDALARKAVGDAAAAAVFEGTLLYPLQRDLLARTWLPERFDCQGRDAHNAFYFEYSSTVALMLYEVRYGISLTMTAVLVDPLSARGAWDYAMGPELHIGWYNGTAFYARLTAGHTGTRDFTVSRMEAGSYTVGGATGVAPFAASVGSDGVLAFTVAVGEGYDVSVSKD